MSKILGSSSKKKILTSKVKETVLVKPYIKDNLGNVETTNTIIDPEPKPPKEFIESEREDIVLKKDTIPDELPELEDTPTTFVKDWVIGEGEDTEECLKVNNFLSEFNTLYKKAQARKNLGISESMELFWGRIKGDIRLQKDLVDAFKQINDRKLDVSSYDDLVNAINHPYESEELEGVTNVKEALDKLAYKELVINNFYCTPNLLEIGEKINSVKLNWEYNKKIILSQTINNKQVDKNLRTLLINDIITSNKKYTLNVSDKFLSKNKTAYVSFVPGRYYGVSPLLDITNSTYIFKNFNRSLSLEKNQSFTVTANTGEYIYLLVPKNMQDITFWVGGFEGGFKLINNSFIFSRYGDITVESCLFRSEKPSLGKTTVTIK